MEKVKNTADKLLDIETKKRELEKKFKEEFEDLKKCANRLFSTKDGKYWAKRAFIGLDVNKRDPVVYGSTALMAAEKARRDFYLQFFKELLEPEVLLIIERGQ